MEATTQIVIGRALDGLNLRAAAIAQNIADASSRRPQRVEVSFEEGLRRAAAQGNDAVRAMRIEPRAVFTERADREPRLDLELASASETELRYGALLDLLGRELQLSHAAMQADR